MAAQEHQRLVEALRSLAPNVRRSADAAWSRPPALRIIDCVLSLNRNYDGFVVPRLDAFQNSFPNILTVSGLKTAMEGYRSTDEFMKQALRYNDANA